MAKVSVIIPVYNVEAYLPACLDSVLSQTLRDIEIICIDDHSPDGCGRILDEYAARDGRIKVIHLPENHRQGYGRNRGLEAASGEYVYFLDSDDLIEAEALEELAEICDRDELDAVFFDSKTLYESEELRSVYAPAFSARTGTYRDGVYEGKDLMDAFIRQGEWTCYPQRTFWRRGMLMDEGIRFPEGCVHEDEYFAFAGLLAARRARYVRAQYFILRVRPGSVMTSGYSPKNLHGYLLNYYHMNRFALERGVRSYGAQICISKMAERVETLYAILKDREDLEDPFTKEPDRTLFRLYVSSVQARDYIYALDPQVREEISRFRIVYIYGAGLTGQKVCRKLERLDGVLIGGFIVTDPGEAGRVLMGRPVVCLEEADVPRDGIVVVATRPQFYDEISGLLKARGINCIFHRKIT